ncbi:MAG TPA: M28 family peptidase [Gaiellaceae bacterium]|nr:M28 family peptidase [Gaiellaceae bacterium]
MAAPLPPARRPRRGSLQRPVSSQLYRSAFLVCALPLLLAAFTVTTPGSFPKPLLPPAFDAATTLRLARELSTQYPDRVPGSPGALAAAEWYREQLAPYGLPTLTDAWRERLPGDGRVVRLQNLSTVARGRSPDVIVVAAHRDDTGAGPGANDNATGTAALIELARAYAQPATEAQAAVQSAHTIVFLSTDGGAYGGLGAVRFATHSLFRNHVVAVIDLDAIGGTGAPRLELAGERPRTAAASLVATATSRVLEQTGRRPGHAGFLAQLVDLAFPFTLREQGAFLAQGIPALTLTTGGSRPPAAFGDTAGRLAAPKLVALGRAAQELLGSLNQSLEVPPGTPSAVWVGARAIRGWAVELVLISLLVPFVVASVDLFALGRRHGMRLAPALRALRSRLLFWAFAGGVFTCFRALGAFGSGPPRPPNPDTAGDWPALALTGLAAVVGVGWVVVRHRLTPRRTVRPEEVLAGQTVALLALAVVALLVVATNPFALLFVLPALHLWLWLPQVQRSGAAARLALFAAGLAGPGILLASLAWRFGLGLDAPWYLLRLVAVGYVGTTPVLVVLAGAAAASQLAAAAAGRYAPYPAASERPPRGPLRELVRIVVLGVGGRRAQERRRAVAG